MAVNRKRKKEFARLKNDTATLLGQQRVVLDEASRVVREAGRQAGSYAREEAAPRLREGYETRVHPAIDKGASIARSAAHATRDKLTDDVLPSVGAAVGAAVAALDVTNHPDVKAAIKQVSETARSARTTAAKSSVGKKAANLAASAGVAKPKGSGPGKYILIGLGVVVVAAVAYAAYQTLRADDDLWIDDEDVDQADVETPQSEDEES